LEPSDGSHNIFDLRFTIYDLVRGVNRNRPRLRKMPLPSILPRVNRLTRQEIYFIVTVAALLLTGLLVKYYRQSHPPAAAVTPDHHARN
jgi:hypothetical protein